MNKNFTITEQDIFNYVFYPETLSPDMRHFIDKHQSDFKSQIELCKALNETASSDSNIIYLLRVEPSTLNLNTHFTLAAASSELSKKIETMTFMDSNSQFLVRLVASGGEKTLYVFPKDQDFKEAKLTLLPSQKSFSISPVESTIKIDDSENIEKISIEKFS